MALHCKPLPPDRRSTLHAAGQVGVSFGGDNLVMPPTPHHAAAAAGRPAGRSTAVLMLHGLCSTPDELFAVAASLRSAGDHVEELSVPGYSYDASRQRQHASAYQSWIAVVTERAIALRAGHPRVVLLGISAGATLALAVALGAPQALDGVVLMSTPLRLDGWGVPRLQWALPLALYTPLGRLWRYSERHPYGVKDDRVRRWVERQLHDRKVSAAGSAVLEVSHLRENHRLTRHVVRRLNATLCPPVLALHARDDEMASLSNVALLSAQLRCQSFRSVILENSYHMISIDNDRRQVIHATLEFIGALATERDAVSALAA